MGQAKIANSSQAAAQGDSPSLETTLAFAEQRQEMLEAELAQLDGSQQPTVMHLTPAKLERHLQGMTEKLRSGVNGKVQEAIQQSVARILVGFDGTLTIEAKPDALLGVEEIHARLGADDHGGMIQQTLPPSSGRRWRVTMASI